MEAEFDIDKNVFSSTNRPGGSQARRKVLRRAKTFEDDAETRQLISRPTGGMSNSTDTVLSVAGLLIVGILLIMSGFVVIVTESHRMFRWESPELLSEKYSILPRLGFFEI